MADVDFSEIVHSPLDEPPTGGSWWPAIVGLVLGAAIVLGGFVLAADEPAPAETTVVTTTGSAEPPPEPEVPLDEVAFPPGYEPLTDVVALAPVSALVIDDELLIGVSTVVRRGFDPEGALTSAGSWVLETSAGDTLASTGAVVDPATPGLFSVVFPNPGDVELTTLRMIERWDPDPRDGSQTAQAGVLPGIVEGPVVVDLGSGVTLNVSAVTIGEQIADLTWELAGTTRGGDVRVGVRVQADGTDLGLYFPAGDLFFHREALDPDETAGTIGLQRDQGLRGDLATATDIVVEATVTLVVGTPVDLEFDVSDLEVGR